MIGILTLNGAYLTLNGLPLSLGVIPDSTPAEPPFNWQPPVDLATSGIIGQALRFMRLSPVARIDPDAEVLPALAGAFTRSINECLEASDWSFASVLASLPASTLPSGAVNDDLLSHSYQMPGDLLRLRRVGSPATRWRIDAGQLRADAPAPLTIRYTGRITVEAALPATFKTAVALQIASLLGARWAGSTIAADDIAVKAIETLKQAMREDSRHAVAERALPGSDRGGDLGYGGSDDWASEALQ